MEFFYTCHFSAGSVPENENHIVLVSDLKENSFVRQISTFSAYRY